MALWRFWPALVCASLLVLTAIFCVPKLIAHFSDTPEGFGEHYDNMIHFHLRGDAALPEGRIILLGDSLIQGLPAAAVSDLAVNYGIGSDTTLGMMSRVSQYQSLKHASAIVLAIGINDMSQVDNQTIEARYADLLNQLPPGVPVFCSAALPVDEAVQREWQGRSNDRNARWNKRLNALCTNHGATFIPAPDALSDENGQLHSAMHEGDGLHLNATGNAVWARWLKNAIEH